MARLVKRKGYTPTAYPENRGNWKPAPDPLGKFSANYRKLLGKAVKYSLEQIGPGPFGRHGVLSLMQRAYVAAWYECCETAQKVGWVEVSKLAGSKRKKK